MLWAGQALDAVGARYNGGVIFQSLVNQFNNEAVNVAQDPALPTQRNGKGKATWNKITVKYSIGVIFGC